MEYHGQVGSDWVSVLRARALHKKQEQCVPIIQPSSLLATPNTSLQQWLDITARHNVSNLMKGGDISTNIPLDFSLKTDNTSESCTEGLSETDKSCNNNATQLMAQKLGADLIRSSCTWTSGMLTPDRPARQLTHSSGISNAGDDTITEYIDSPVKELKKSDDLAEISLLLPLATTSKATSSHSSSGVNGPHSNNNQSITQNDSILPANGSHRSNELAIIVQSHERFEEAHEKSPSIISGLLSTQSSTGIKIHSLETKQIQNTLFGKNNKETLCDTIFEKAEIVGHSKMSPKLKTKQHSLCNKVLARNLFACSRSVSTVRPDERVSRPSVQTLAPGCSFVDYDGQLSKHFDKLGHKIRITASASKNNNATISTLKICNNVAQSKESPISKLKMTSNYQAITNDTHKDNGDSSAMLTSPIKAEEESTLNESQLVKSPPISTRTPRGVNRMHFSTSTPLLSNRLRSSLRSAPPWKDETSPQDGKSTRKIQSEYQMLLSRNTSYLIQSNTEPEKIVGLTSDTPKRNSCNSLDAVETSEKIGCNVVRRTNKLFIRRRSSERSFVPALSEKSQKDSSKSRDHKFSSNISERDVDISPLNPRRISFENSKESSDYCPTTKAIEAVRKIKSFEVISTSDQLFNNEIRHSSLGNFGKVNRSNEASQLSSTVHNNSAETDKFTESKKNSLSITGTENKFSVSDTKMSITITTEPISPFPTPRVSKLSSKGMKKLKMLQSKNTSRSFLYPNTNEEPDYRANNMRYINSMSNTIESSEIINVDTTMALPAKEEKLNTNLNDVKCPSTLRNSDTFPIKISKFDASSNSSIRTGSSHLGMDASVSSGYCGSISYRNVPENTNLPTKPSINPICQPSHEVATGYNIDEVISRESIKQPNTSADKMNRCDSIPVVPAVLNLTSDEHLHKSNSNVIIGGAKSSTLLSESNNKISKVTESMTVLSTFSVNSGVETLDPCKVDPSVTEALIQAWEEDSFPMEMDEDFLNMSTQKLIIPDVFSSGFLNRKSSHFHISKDIKSQDSKSEDFKSQNVFQDAKSQDSKSQDSKSQDSKSQDSKSQDSKSQNSKSQDSKSQDSKSQDSKSQDSKSSEDNLYEVPITPKDDRYVPNNSSCISPVLQSKRKVENILFSDHKFASKIRRVSTERNFLHRNHLNLTSNKEKFVDSKMSLFEKYEDKLNNQTTCSLPSNSLSRANKFDSSKESLNRKYPSHKTSSIEFDEIKHDLKSDFPLSSQSTLLEKGRPSFIPLTGFSTAKGKAITVKSDALMQAKRLWDNCNSVDNDLRPCMELSVSKDACTGFTNTEEMIPNIIISDKNCCNSDKEISKGFCTSRGAAINVSACAMLKATRLWKESGDDSAMKSPIKIHYNTNLLDNKSVMNMTTESLSNSDNIHDIDRLNEFPGFVTAHGKAVKTNAESFKKARSMWNKTDSINNSSKVAVDIKLDGFSTAKGNAIKVKKDTLQKAELLWKESGNDTTTNNSINSSNDCSLSFKTHPDEDKIHSESTSKEMNGQGTSFPEFSRFKNAKDVKEFQFFFNKSSVDQVSEATDTLVAQKCSGFKTAKGANVKVNDDALKKAQVLWNESGSFDESTESLKTNTSFVGFTTAKGSSVKVGATALLRAKGLLNTCDETKENHTPPKPISTSFQNTSLSSRVSQRQPPRQQKGKGFIKHRINPSKVSGESSYRPESFPPTPKKIKTNTSSRVYPTACQPISNKKRIASPTANPMLDQLTAEEKQMLDTNFSDIAEEFLNDDDWDMESKDYTTMSDMTNSKVETEEKELKQNEEFKSKSAEERDSLSLNTTDEKVKVSTGSERTSTMEPIYEMARIASQCLSKATTNNNIHGTTDDSRVSRLKRVASATTSSAQSTPTTLNSSKVLESTSSQISNVSTHSHYVKSSTNDIQHQKDGTNNKLMIKTNTNDVIIDDKVNCALIDPLSRNVKNATDRTVSTDSSVSITINIPTTPLSVPNREGLAFSNSPIGSQISQTLNTLANNPPNTSSETCDAHNTLHKPDEHVLNDDPKLSPMIVRSKQIRGKIDRLRRQYSTPSPLQPLLASPAVLSTPYKTPTRARRSQH